MKQYKDTERPNYTCLADAFMPTNKARNLETIGKSQDRESRIARRAYNKSAETWWRRQIQSYGMPWLYHCGGAK